MKFGNCENDKERVELLMSYGYQKAKAEEIVKNGKFDETLEYDYRIMVEDPVGAFQERVRDEYDSIPTAKAAE